MALSDKSERRTPDGPQIPGSAKPGSRAMPGVAFILCPIHPQLGAEYGLRGGRIGHVQQRRIQVHSGAHIAGWLGAAQRPCIMATRQRLAHANSYADAYTDGDTHTYTNPHAPTLRRRHVRAGMESQSGLLQ